MSPNELNIAIAPILKNNLDHKSPEKQQAEADQQDQ